MHFPYRDAIASGGILPREVARMGSPGLTSLLLRRLLQLQRVHVSARRSVLKLASCVVRRVYSWQPNSPAENACVVDMRSNAFDRGHSHREFLQQLSESDRARLLTADVCRNILTNWHFYPDDEPVPDYDVFPRPVVFQLADAFMRNLFDNLSEGELYVMAPEWHAFWRAGIRLMSQASPIALESFMRTHFIFKLCDTILSEFECMCAHDLYEFPADFYTEHHASHFPALCYMLADVLDLDASLLMPCVQTLQDVLSPHWQHLRAWPSCGFCPWKFRSALEAIGSGPVYSPSAAMHCFISPTSTIIPGHPTAFSPMPSSHDLLPFPIDDTSSRRCATIIELLDLQAGHDRQCHQLSDVDASLLAQSQDGTPQSFSIGAVFLFSSIARRHPSQAREAGSFQAAIAYIRVTTPTPNTCTVFR
jgi:hypothetical protein